MQHEVLGNDAFFLIKLNVELLAKNFHHDLILGSSCESSELLLSIGLEFGHNIITSYHSVNFHLLSKLIKKFISKVDSNDDFIRIVGEDELLVFKA